MQLNVMIQGWASILQTCTLQLLVGSQRTKVEIPLVKVQGLRSLVYDVMSGVVELFQYVIWFMWQVNSHYNIAMFTARFM